jgi:hypothetical protein
VGVASFTCVSKINNCSQVGDDGRLKRVAVIF